MTLPTLSSMSPRPLSLSRHKRIKHGRDFSRAKTKGRRLAHGVLVLNWVNPPAGESSRLGVITGRKVGHAAVRNQARRLLRESFRLHQHQLVRPLDLILVARPSIAGRNFSAVESDLLTALGRAGLLKTGV